MPDLFSLFLLAAFTSISELVCVALSSAIPLINFLSYLRSFVSTSIHCGLLSSSNFLSILDVSLGLNRGRAWASARERRLERAETSSSKSTSEEIIFFEALIETSTEASESSESSKAAEATEATKGIILTSSSLALFVRTLSLGFAETSEASKEVIFIIVSEEARERILAPEEISKNIFSSLERKASVESVESSKRTSS